MLVFVFYVTYKRFYYRYFRVRCKFEMSSVLAGRSVSGRNDCDLI